jgi:H+/Cl- antiporter ClcA
MYVCMYGHNAPPPPLTTPPLPLQQQQQQPQPQTHTPSNNNKPHTPTPPTTTTALLNDEVSGKRLPGASFFTYWLLNCLYVLIANLTVLIEPVAAGSGIPEIKAFLNGVNLPR